MMKKIKTAILTGLMTCLLLATASADDHPKFKEVRFSLIHAQNKGIEETMPLAPKLRKSLNLLFGYSKYRVLGEARSELREGEIVHFQPHSLFYVKLLRDHDNPYCYSFDLMREDRTLMKGKYTPKREVPLIIRGPFYDKGNLILVIESEFKSM